MAKNQHSPKSSGLCEKLYNATLRRISHNPKNSIPAPPPPPPPTAPPHVSHVKAAAAAPQQLPSSGEVIPIEFDPPQLLPTVLQNPIVAKYQGGSFKLKMQPDNMNDKFSDYIGRVKNRMRSSSNVGKPKISSRPDSFNDNVSNYIRQTQGKMRTSSTNVAAGGNSVDILGSK